MDQKRFTFLSGRVIAFYESHGYSLSRIQAIQGAIKLILELQKQVGSISIGEDFRDKILETNLPLYRKRDINHVIATMLYIDKTEEVSKG